MTDMTLSTPLAWAGLGLVVGLAASGCSHDAKAAPEASPAVPVAVTRVAPADIADTFETGGLVQARTTATIMARIAAPIRDVHAVPGDHVRAGQVLVVLDGRDLTAQGRRAQAAERAADQDVLAAESDRQGADAALTLARATHGRIAGLEATRSATPQELDEATGALRMAEARAAAATARARAAVSGVDGARAAREAAETLATYSRITAPFDGVVTETMVELGNMAVPGGALMRVEDTRGFRLDVMVDESRLGRIAPGAQVPIAFDAGTGRESTVLLGTVYEVGHTLDADARAYLVKIALPARPGMRSGTFGRARFSVDSRSALIVPADALVRRGQVTSVFVVEGDVARVRLVQVSGTEVLAGLSEGDVVILSPPSTLVDGRRVTAGGGR